MLDCARLPKLLGLSFACLLVLAVAPAGASWSTAPPLSNPLAGDSSVPAIAVAPNGAAIAVWRELGGNGVEYASRPAGGAFGTRQTLEGPGISPAESKPAVALNSAGAAVAAWTYGAFGEEVVKASYREPGKAFSAPVTISPDGENATAPAVAIGAGGKAVVVWAIAAGTLGENFAEASVHGATGAFLDGQLLNRAEDTGTILPLKAEVAMDGAGNAIAAFPSQRPGGPGFLDPLQWCYMPAASTAFGTPSDLAATGNSPELAFAADGRATVAWQTNTGVVRSAEESAGGGGSFGPAKDVSVPAGETASKPDVGVGGSGSATVVFQAEPPGGGDSSVKVATRPAGGGFTSPITLSSAGDSGDAQVAVDAAGNAAAVWTRAPTGKAETVEASYRAAGGSFAAPATTLASNTGSARPGHLPAVAVDAAGNPTVVWRSTLSIGVVWASTYAAGATPLPGGGGAGEGGGGATSASPPISVAPPAATIPPAPVPAAKKKALKCRKGFKKKTVRGKAKCVKAVKPKKKR